MGHGEPRERTVCETPREVGMEFKDDWPEEARAAVEPYVEAMVALLPRWVRSLHLRWDSTDGDNTAKVWTNTRNRWATITVCTQWLDEVESERWNTLVHEVVHVYMDGMAEAFKMTMGQLDDEASRKIAGRWFRDMEEQAVTDLVDMIVKMVPAPHGAEKAAQNPADLLKQVDSKTAQL